MHYNPKNSISKYSNNIDFRILFIFILFILIGLSILFYKYSRHINCGQIEFIIKAENKQVGESIGFEDLTPGANSWIWDFGDNSPKNHDRSPSHKYSKSGIYIVTLKVNKSCTLKKTLEIKNINKIIDSTKIPIIIAPTLVTVGQRFAVDYDYLGEATSWEWSFGESGQVDYNSEYPIYSYSTPGKKRLTLIINGDITYIASKDIYVKPEKTNVPTLLDIPRRKIPDSIFVNKPPKPEKDPLDKFIAHIPAMPKESPQQLEPINNAKSQAPSISENQFALLLLDVAKQNKTMEDFGKYTCNKYDFPVSKNDDDVINFNKFTQEIQNKKIRIKSIHLKKNSENCIEGFNILYKTKKGPFWIYTK